MLCGEFPRSLGLNREQLDLILVHPHDRGILILTQPLSLLKARFRLFQVAQLTVNLPEMINYNRIIRSDIKTPGDVLQGFSIPLQPVPDLAVSIKEGGIPRLQFQGLAG